jgi:hypothetical protein
MLHSSRGETEANIKLSFVRSLEADQANFGPLVQPAPPCRACEPGPLRAAAFPLKNKEHY